MVDWKAQLDSLGTNKIFIGMCLFLLNIAARNIYLELSPQHLRLLDHDLVKRFILFSLFFVGTRDAVAALALTLVFSIFVLGFLHQDSKLNFVQGKAERDAKARRIMDASSFGV
jgi:hypothetical protein